MNIKRIGKGIANVGAEVALGAADDAIALVKGAAEGTAEAYGDKDNIKDAVNAVTNAATGIVNTVKGKIEELTKPAVVKVQAQLEKALTEIAQKQQ